MDKDISKLNVTDLLGPLLICVPKYQKLKLIVLTVSFFSDNLIVLTDSAVIYFNINNFEAIKTLQISKIDVSRVLKRVNDGLPYGLRNRTRAGICGLRQPRTDSLEKVNWYQETSSLIAELNSTEILKLSLTNKLHTEPVDSDTVNKIYINRPFTYKVHLNSCYVISESVLWVYTAKPNRWDTKRIAKYYGDEILLHSIHIHNENVYVLLTKGDVLLADLNHNKFKKIFHLTDPLSLWGGDSVPFMFGTCILLRNVPNAKPCEHPEVNPYRKTESLSSIYRDGVTCVLEHGHVVLLGYRDGDIEIYLYKKIIDSGVPEVKFNLQYFIDGTMHKEPDLRIRSLDIYDDDAGHHLFVSTYCNVYEVLLSF
ncbi:uncharacterized protein LOC112048566 [Bicyclus anynana]|uniref:Uncharacterized protein LOC112048566 n=1 Tax=Bicyclus anynana TaxID=110368 RepID=A0ABM3LHS5_BICAN|nr:uncharacterized protein LOC112048566 [Bicyclus anynana]